jgi:hypothetical protein
MTAGSGNLADWADVARAVDPPRIRLVTNATQATLTSGTAVAIAFGVGTEITDPNGFHDEVTNNTRVTPNIAGTYEIRGAVAFGGRTDYTSVQAFVRTNAATVWAPAGKVILSATQINSTLMVPFGPLLIPFNGSTDYVELMAQQSNGAAAAGSAVASLQLASVLELIYRYA